MKAKYLVFGKGLLGSAFEPVEDAVVLSKEQCDITNRDALHQVIKSYKPEVVINCAGIVPRNNASTAHTFKVNSFAPHYIADICFYNKIHFIHMSTDCVFSGEKGSYTELDEKDAKDVYGMSKVFGEPTEYGLVVRASFIGLPDPAGRGLLHWASQQQEIVGYDKVFWNGLTNKEVSGKILEYAKDRVSGIRHVYSYTISKYELLKCAKDVFGWDVPVVKESEITETPHVFDKTLYSIHPSGFVSKPIRQQLEELHVSI